MQQKLLLGFLVLLLVVTSLLGVRFFLRAKYSNNLITKLNEQLMEANLELGKAHTKFGNANDYINELEGKLKKEIKAKDETMVIYGKLLAKYNATNSGTVPITLPVDSTPVVDGMPFELHDFYFANTENTLVSLGPQVDVEFVDHRIKARVALLSKQGQPGWMWDYALSLRLSGQMVQTTTMSGAVNHYFSLWEVDEKGKKLGKLQLTSFEVVKTDQRIKQYFFGPFLDMGVVGGLDITGKPLYGGSVGVSLFGYGLTENDLEVKGLRLGMTISERLGVEVSPLLWNIGRPLPLITNLWVGPNFTWNGKYGLALLMGVGL